MFSLGKNINKLRTFGQLMVLDLLLASHAQAQLTDTIKTTDNFDTIASNASKTMNTAVGVITLFFGLVGLFMVANSLFNLYKSSKDPSHQVKPMSGGIGLIIGGLLLAVGTVAGLSRNTLVS